MGAAAGDFSWECSQVFGDARYIMVEPLEEFADLLQERSNQLGDAVYVQAAAAETGADLTINVHEDLFGSSLLNEAEGAAVDGTARRVRGVTVDQLVAEHAAPGPYILKADVQGAELRALDGASNTLRETQLVMLETAFFNFFIDGPLFGDVIHYMNAVGFVPYDFLNPLYRPLDGALSQVDVIFVPHDSMLRKDHVFATPSQRQAINERLLARARTPPSGS